MNLPHNAVVLVADGRKMLLLRNTGSADQPTLTVEHGEEHPSAADRDQKSDAAGRASSTTDGGGSGGGHGSMDEPDYHQQEEDRFAADVAAFLGKRAQAKAFESLIVVAAPRTLGELRKHYPASVTQLIVGELAKDLTGRPVDAIAKAIAAA